MRGLVLAALLVIALLPASARAESTRWRWPLPAPHTVLAPFEAPAHRYGPGHRGIDIAAGSPGAQVRAVAAGTVRFSGRVAGRGVVSVQHADGLISTYEPVVGAVEVGSPVAAGAVLGALGSPSELSHCSGTPCLHLGARRGEGYVDPLLLLGGHGPSVLLPWGGGGAERSVGAAASPRAPILRRADAPGRWYGAAVPR